MSRSHSNTFFLLEFLYLKIKDAKGDRACEQAAAVHWNLHGCPRSAKVDGGGRESDCITDWKQRNATVQMLPHTPTRTPSSPCTVKKKKKGAVAHPFPLLLHIRATRGHYAQRELAEVSALTCLTRQVHVLLEIRLWAGEREKASQSVSSISFQVVEPHSGTVRRFHPNALGKKNNNMHLISAASLTAVAPGLQTNSSTQTSLRKIQPCGVW